MLTTPNVYASSRLHWRPWRDTEKNKLVLTFVDEDAFILVSLVVLLVGLIATCLWSLIRVVWGRFRNPINHADPGQPRNSLATVDKLFFKEKGSVDVMFFLAFHLMARPVWKTIVRDKGLKVRVARIWEAWLMWLTATVITLAAIGISVGLSSWLTYGSEENPSVLSGASNDDGGLYIIGAEATSGDLDRYTRLASAESWGGAAYYESCYKANYRSQCLSGLNSDTLPFTTTRDNIPCPFADGICLQPPTASDPPKLFSPVRMETPWLSMNELGFNTPAKLQLRKRCTCAPIDAENNFVLNKDTFTKDEYQAFDFSESAKTPNGIFTHFYFDNTTSAYGYRFSVIPQADKGLKDEMAHNLTTPDGRTTLMLVSSPGVFYRTEMRDPLFRATISLGSDSDSLWLSPERVRTMGCVDSVEIQNTDRGTTTGWQAAVLGAANYSLNKDVYVSDEEIIMGNLLLFYALQSSSTYETLRGRDTSALEATRSLLVVGTAQAPLPVDQSRVEAETWFGTQLAKLQTAVLAIGVPDPNFNFTGFTSLLDRQTFAGAEKPQYQDLYRRIKFRSGGHSMIDFWGVVALIIVAGVLFIVDMAVRFVLHRKKRERIHREIEPMAIGRDFGNEEGSGSRSSSGLGKEVMGTKAEGTRVQESEIKTVP